LLVQAVAAIVALGSMLKNKFDLNGLQSIVPAVSVIGAAAAQAFYSHARAVVKAAAQSSAAQVEVAKATTQVLNTVQTAQGQGAAGEAKTRQLAVGSPTGNPEPGAVHPIIINLTAPQPVLEQLEAARGLRR
jgi:hypothetical protein